MSGRLSGVVAVVLTMLVVVHAVFCACVPPAVAAQSSVRAAHPGPPCCPDDSTQSPHETTPSHSACPHCGKALTADRPSPVGTAAPATAVGLLPLILTIEPSVPLVQKRGRADLRDSLPPLDLMTRLHCALVL